MFDEDYGVQSYFGESGDCDFFGDTSMSGGFASGMGEAGFVSEAFAQEAVGGSFFTEASEFDTMGSKFFTETDDNITPPPGTPGIKPENNPHQSNDWGDMSRFGDKAEIESKTSFENQLNGIADKYDKRRPADAVDPRNTTHVTPGHFALRTLAKKHGDESDVEKAEHDISVARKRGKEIQGQLKKINKR